MAQHDQRDPSWSDEALFELLHNLVLQLQSPDADEDAQTRLRELLRTNPQARRLYVEYIYENVGISAMLQSSSSPVEVVDEPCESVDSADGKLLTRSIDRIHRFFAQPTPLSLSVAGLVVCGIIGLMALTAAPFYRAFTQRPSQPVIVHTAKPVAQITGEHQVVWREVDESAPRSRSLLAGRRLDLESGLLELTFADGATATIKAPARCVVDSKSEITLVHGTLVANVPDEAVGFTVITSVMHIVDLGTEFGVEVTKSGSGEVHVMTGKVELKDAQALDSAGRLLTAGQAWKFTAQGGADGQLAQSMRQRFSFSVPKPETVVIQNGKPIAGTGEPYSGAEDVMLIEWARGNNFGTRPDFDVGQNQGQRGHTLLRFDLSSLSDQVDRVLSATLVITPNNGVDYLKDSGAIDLYRVSDANHQWRAGTIGNGGTAGSEDGSASWNRLSHPDTRWAGTHGAAQPGTDYDAQPLANVWYSAHTNTALRFRIRGDLNFIHDWIEGGPNAGFLLKEMTGKPQNRINFHSCESESITARPQLVIQYLPKEQSASVDPAEPTPENEET